jgi:hypothetical protein
MSYCSVEEREKRAKKKKKTEISPLSPHPQQKERERERALEKNSTAAPFFKWWIPTKYSVAILMAQRRSEPWKARGANHSTRVLSFQLKVRCLAEYD